MKIGLTFCTSYLIMMSVICLRDEALFTRRYIEHKNLKSYTFLSCHTSEEHLTIMEKVRVPSRFWNIRKYMDDTHEVEQRNNMLYILFYNCNGSLQALKKAGENNHLKFKYKWLILLQSTDDISLLELENVELSFNSDVKIVVWSMNNIIRIYDAYNTGYKRNGSVVLSYYGHWNKNTSTLSVKNVFERYHKKSILSGVVLRTSTVITDPDVKINYEHYLLERKPVDLISKFSYSLFIIFQQMHNFSHIQFIQDKWFGNDAGGFEDGVAKDLHEEISDMSSAAGLIKTTRVEFFDFINPMYRFSTTFMLRSRGTHDLWENEFLKPFTTRVWLSIVLVLTLLIICLKITNWVEIKLMRSNGTPYSLFTAILITFSVLCQQGSSIIPSRWTSRLLFFIILILSFLLYNYYTSSIVSALLNAKPRELTSYKDLIKSGLELGIQMAPYTFTIFETNMDPDIQAIRRLVFPERGKPHIWNITDGLEKIRTGPYAYHVESSRAYILIAKTFDPVAICELSDKITLIPASFLSFFTKKDSQYKNLLKISLRRMQETGIVHRNRQIWEEKKPSCLANAILLSVGLDQTFIAFFILFVGFSFSIWLLILERWYNRRHMATRRMLFLKNSLD